MNIKLKPIAESKVRQLGGDVCGVLVRTEDSEVMAVSEHGRCTRLDAVVMGPVDRAQGGQGVGVVGYTNRRQLQFPVNGWGMLWPEKSELADVELYTQPQPAVPDGIDVAVDMLEDYASALGNGDLDGAGHSTTQAIYGVIDMLSIPTTPQADGWVRCEDRLPEPRRQSRKTPNGILAKHESGRITQFRDVTETLLQYMRNGPRKPTKFEQPVSERITEWMDLDAERAGGKQ
ncbi:hypothetical protein [Marinobacter nauticus]|uniref:hypothetical protein n=1 Tax=Marinobacter nauticus TaxID=2743 RepID=UPI001C938560|nr:hypothetical protein [Marinobacter nauticus]MBY6102344.1 hypothetical protein [Marinobacter nauticus]